LVLLNGLTSTPNAPVAATGDGVLEEGADGEAVRVELAGGDGDLAAVVPGRLQAPAMTNATTPSAEARHRVRMISGNDTLRIGLRFRYDPAPEAGHRPSPPGLCSKGSRLRRMASGYPFCFI
jgi:hypothetical protein